VLGSQRSGYVDFVDKTRIALKHIMFENWQDSYETLPYPAATGTYALYKEEDLISHLNYAMKNVCILTYYRLLASVIQIIIKRRPVR